MPAWKADKILETREASQVDLAALGEATGILFESQDMLSKAVLCLDRLRKKKTNEKDADLDKSETSDSHSSDSQDKDKGENIRSNDQKQIVRLPRLLGLLRQFPVQPAEAPALATKDRSHSLSHRLTLVDNKGRRHPRLMKLARISRSLRLNLPKSGLIALRRVKVCYCLQMDQADVQHF